VGGNFPADLAAKAGFVAGAAQTGEVGTAGDQGVSDLLNWACAIAAALTQFDEGPDAGHCSIEEATAEFLKDSDELLEWFHANYA
jgi:hypothetical protein